MSTVQITLTGLFLVVPTGNHFTILLPNSGTHHHRPPTVGNSEILDEDIDLTAVLPSGGASIPADATIPVTTFSGNRPVQSHLLTDPLPIPELHARIKLPKPTHLRRVGRGTLWKAGGTHLIASNEVEFIYENHSQSSITVGPEVFTEIPGPGRIRVPFVHRAVVEPGCVPGAEAHHVKAYYDLLDPPPGDPPIPELQDSCPAAFGVLALSETVLSDLPENLVDLRLQYGAAGAELAASMSTFTCLVGSAT